MVRQPVLEKVLELVRQTQQHIARLGRAGLMRRGERSFEPAVVDHRDHRRGQHTDGDAGPREAANRLDAAIRRGGTRFQLARQVGVQRGARHEHLDQPARRHRPEDVDVALDQRRLGDQPDRLAELGTHLKHRARDLPVTLHRLVGVGVGADRNRFAHIGRARQLGAQQFRRVALGKQLRLEVQPRRQAPVRIARPRIAIHAAMLATVVRVDRLVERNVRRLVARNDRLGQLRRDGGDRCGRLVFATHLGIFQAAPAVVDLLARMRVEAHQRRELRAAALERGSCRRVAHAWLPVPCNAGVRAAAR